MSVRYLFYSKNRDLSKSDHVCGSESCPEGDYCGPLKFDVAHQARQGYKTIPKEIGLHKYKVRQILYK